jgi:hypothetical protein
MKLPFDFGVKLFFRLLLPGFFLTLGFSPILLTMLDQVGWSGRYEIAFIVSIMLMGWVLIVLDMPIYMLLEGRRLWPNFLWSFFFSLEKKRLKRIKERLRKLEHIDRKKYLEASVELRKFPINAEGEFDVIYPTRLGNLITAFETYPDTRYGMDGVFYWNRIWLELDKDLREEIDSHQALADSAVYTTFALSVTGLLWFIYASLTEFGISLVKHLPATSISWLISSTSFLVAFAMYRVSIHTNGQFGELFKSVFDTKQKKIDFSDVVEMVSELTRDPSLRNVSQKEKLKIAWRYLHNYRVKCPICGKVIPVPQIESHYNECHRAIEGGLLEGISSPDVKQSSIKA